MSVTAPATSAAASPVAAQTSGVGGAFSRLFETIGNTAADFVGDLAVLGRERALDSIFGPSLDPLGQAGVTTAPTTTPGPTPTPAPEPKSFFGVDQDTALLIGGGVLATIAVIALLRG